VQSIADQSAAPDIVVLSSKGGDSLPLFTRNYHALCDGNGERKSINLRYRLNAASLAR
jgi:hypothetical protein